MTGFKSEAVLQELLDLAGVAVNGDRPFDIQVHDEGLYERIMKDGVLAAGESFMDEWWDCQAIDELMCKVIVARPVNQAGMNLKLALHLLKSRIFNLQTMGRAFQVGKQHYDIGNDLYEAMLDRRMVYTCGYWKNAETLDDAQEAKLDLVCRKTGLEQGMRVLDLGCGWGAFAKYAAEKYGVTVTGVTVSKQQVELGQKMCRGLPVEIRLDDYRNVDGKYDRVISIGIMEHVGYKNYRTYMKKTESLLEDDGIAFVHTIGGNITKTTSDPFMTEYVFPNGMIPSIAQLGKAMEGLFVMEDWHNFGPDYDKTLMAWYANFQNAWPELKAKYGHRFYRMWRYYLLSCAGAFRARGLQVWQIVMTKQGRKQTDCRMS
ncbi:MAG: cyclopropane fatty acyl phospholipid synthase [Desulfobacterales bacterium]|nr:cyclopropane fatty acyl phospholipid synthase [Desulfobacterales bacterium]